MAIQFNWQNEKLKKGLAFTAVFTVSMVFFLFLTFPYEIFKETLSSNIKRSTGFDVAIGSMGVSFPIGIRLSNVVVSKPGVNQPIKFEEIKAKVGILPLLIGNLGIYLSLEKVGATSKDNGDFDLAMKAGLFSLIFRGAFKLKSFSLNASKFDISDVVGLALTLEAKKPSTGPLVGPLLEAIDFKGKLAGNIDVSMGGAGPSTANGPVSLSLQDANLTMKDGTIPPQKFKKALIKAEFKNGTLNFDKNAGIEAEDLTVAIGGQLGMREMIGASALNVTINVQLRGGLKENFGYLVDSLAKGTDGQTTIAIGGTFAQPSYNTGSL